MDSLCKLDVAWVMFHNNLQYFVDKDICKNHNDFNIPKLHSMHHYIKSIISFGSADGYSTESSERLHIDFAKAAYQPTNKKKYIKQMMKWLECQEGCFWFASYFSWTLPGYVAELMSVGEAKNDADDDNEESEVPDDDGEQANCLGYSVAKKPAHLSVPITTLIDHYRAVDFIPHLTQFLKSSLHASRSAKAPVMTSTLPVYKCITVQLPTAPQVIRSITKDVIHARPATPVQGLTPAVPNQFDTVLARESDPEDSNIGHPLDGEYIHFPLCTQDIVSPIQGLTVGQV